MSDKMPDLKALAIDRSGSLQQNASVMLELLECVLAGTPVEVRVFDSRGKIAKYTCEITYHHHMAANITHIPVTNGQKS